MADSATKLKKEDMVREAAKRYLADRAYLAVLGKPQTAKLRHVLKAVDVDGVTTRLLRSVMAESSRFESVDRRWAPSVRYGDSRRPVERVLADILASAGVPLGVDTLAEDLAQVYGRSVDHFRQVLPRLLSDTEKFFGTDDGRYGLASWLIVASSENEADVIFDSFLSEDDVEEYSRACPAGKWDADKIADSASAVVAGCKQPVPVKVLALLAWREIGEDFDPAEFYSCVASDDRILLLSDQRAYPADAAKDFQKALGSMAQEMAALPVEAEEEEGEEAISVTDTDKEEIVSMILDRGTASAEELLEAVVEVSPDEPAYAGALESLKQALEGEGRVMWIGGTRWSKVVSFPDEVLVIPEALIVPPSVPFETAEGDVYDQELEEDGFEGNLKAVIYDPLAEDVTDEDPARTMYQPNGPSQRCVLKYHHKTEGTFPLCQINPEFFGLEPEIIPITLVEEGKRKQAYVNNSTRLIYGLRDFYSSITEVSGAVFHIERSPKPGEYRFRYEGEVDEQLGIDTGRSLELLDIKARLESQEMPVYDIVVQILEQRKQGMTFPSLVNEVNIVKRCSRLLVASILSSYHAFHTRGKSDAWQYDAKKASQGFNKTKRKYIKK